MEEGIDGLLRDKTRPSRIPPLGPEVAERVLALTLGDPPVEATHWTAAMMAAETGISESAVRRIWRSHGLQPHRCRQFELSNDPDTTRQYGWLRAARCDFVADSCLEDRVIHMLQHAIATLEAWPWWRCVA